MTEKDKKKFLDLETVVSDINNINASVKEQSGKVLYTIIKLSKEEDTEDGKTQIDISDCKLSGVSYVGKNEALVMLKEKALYITSVKLEKNKYFKEYEDLVFKVEDQDGKSYDINQVDLEFDRIRLMNTIYNKIRTRQYDNELTENNNKTEVMGK